MAILKFHYFITSLFIYCLNIWASRENSFLSYMRDTFFIQANFRPEAFAIDTRFPDALRGFTLKNGLVAWQDHIRLQGVMRLIFTHQWFHRLTILFCSIAVVISQYTNVRVGLLYLLVTMWLWTGYEQVQQVYKVCKTYFICQSRYIVDDKQFVWISPRSTFSLSLSAANNADFHEHSWKRWRLLTFPSYCPLLNHYLHIQGFNFVQMKSAWWDHWSSGIIFVCKTTVGSIQP